MCGIYGTTEQIDAQLADHKIRLIDYRGPNYLQSIFIKPNLVFGHVRLSIIDLDERSHQPFEDNGYWIVLNGEIYNYVELRKTYLADASFKTSSDTEVLLKLYQKMGEKCLDVLNGMFAFTIYDPHKNRLFGARDRIGKKPFYYYHKNGCFEFASQPKQIACDKDLSINETAKRYYFNFGNVPEPLSIYSDISKLPAGNYFYYQLDTDTLNVQPYWDLPDSRTTPAVHAFQSLGSLLKDAIKVRLRSDVPLGVFLSGGIDSSLIALLASQVSDTPIKTFSIAFREKGFNEAPYAQQVADYIKSDHHVLECTPDNALQFLESLTDHYDEPFADASAFPSLLVSQFAKQHVDVALSGDGGDELFFGYNRYFKIRNLHPRFQSPRALRYLLSYGLKCLPIDRFQRMSKALRLPCIEDAYLYNFQLFKYDPIFLGEAKFNIPYSDYLYDTSVETMERVMNYDIKQYLAGDILVKMDRASMAHSLEVRCPLLDHRVVDYAQNLPFEQKYRDGRGKWPLRDILNQHFPETLFNRTKAGFTLPFKVWFKTNLKEWVYDHLSKENLALIPDLNVQTVNRLLSNHMSGARDYYHQLWTIINYIMFLKNQNKMCQPVKKTVSSAV